MADDKAHREQQERERIEAEVQRRRQEQLNEERQRQERANQQKTTDWLRETGPKKSK